MNSSDWYENFIKGVKERAKSLKPSEPDQGILYLKADGVEAFDGKVEGCYTFRADGKFGFSEQLVNQLMILAYKQGLRDIERRSYERGYEQARIEFAKATGLFTEQDLD